MAVTRSKRERQALQIDPALRAHMSGQAAPGEKAGEGADPLYDKMADQRARLRAMTPAQRKKALLDRQRHKATYDLPLEVIEAVQELARTLDCPPAHVAALLLRCGLQMVADGEVDPIDYRRPADTPRYTWYLLDTPVEESLPPAQPSPPAKPSPPAPPPIPGEGGGRWAEKRAGRNQRQR